MPVSVPVPTKNPGDVLTSTLWNSYLRDNINKMVNLGHRVLTVAQFAALTGLEDGDECYLEVDGTNGVEWHIRYTSAEATYKWRFLGGPPMYSYLATAELCGSFGAFINLATDGPSVTVARGGDYSVRAGASAYNNSGAAGKTVFFGAAVGNTTPVAQAAVAIPGALGACVGVEDRLNAVAASAVLKCRYETLVDASSQFQGRWISVRPVRLI